MSEPVTSLSSTHLGIGGAIDNDHSVLCRACCVGPVVQLKERIAGRVVGVTSVQSHAAFDEDGSVQEIVAVRKVYLHSGSRPG